MTRSSLAERIVVAVDGGAASAAALRWAAHYVGPRRALVDLLMVIDEHDATLIDQLSPIATETVKRAAASLRVMLPNASIYVHIAHGNAAQKIIAQASGARLVVIGTNRTRTSAAHGTTVPMRVAAASPVTTVVVPASWVSRLGPIVAATSHDDVDDAVVAFASAEAERQRTDLVLAHVWSLPNVGRVPYEAEPGDPIGAIPAGQARILDAMANSVRGHLPTSVAVSTVLSEGKAARQLIDRAHETEAELLVVGRRSTSAMARVLLGSVSREVLLTPPCPIAVIPRIRRGVEVLPDFAFESL